MKTFDDYMRTLPRVSPQPGRPDPQAPVTDPAAFNADRSLQALIARARGPQRRWPRLRTWQAAMAAGVIALGFLAQFGFDAEVMGQGATLDRRLAAVEAGAVSLQAGMDRRLTSQDERIVRGEAVLGQALLPPPDLMRADNLAAAGRLRDAEAAWARFLAENPGSPLTAAVLQRSALAAAALGDCQLALSRRARLKALEPRHPLLSQHQALGNCAAAPQR